MVGLILHRARKGVTASHYDFSTLERSGARALQVWADHVYSIAGKEAHDADDVQLVRA